MAEMMQSPVLDGDPQGQQAVPVAPTENPGKRRLYEDFIEYYVAANPHKKRKDSFREGQELWEEMKNDMNAVQKKIKKMAKTAAKKKRKSEVLRNDPPPVNRISSDEEGDSDAPESDGEVESNSGLSGSGSRSKVQGPVPPELAGGGRRRGREGSLDSNDFQDEDDAEDEGGRSLDGFDQSVQEQDLLDEGLEDSLSYLKPSRPTPAQTKVLEELSMTTERLNSLLEKTETTGLSSLQQKEYEFLAAQKVELQKKLKRLEENRKGQQRYRQRKKQRLSEVAMAFPEVADQLNRMNRNKSGRSRLEEEYPELQQAIMEITGNNGAEQTANMTLKQLTEELKRRGINVSRSAVYLRLMPRLLGSPEAKRHVNTVPVKLRSHEHYKNAGAGRGGGKQHDDRAFADTTLGYLKEIAFLFGPDCVSFLNQDDKVRVFLHQKPIAEPNAPMMLKFQYGLTAQQQQQQQQMQQLQDEAKLIPSIYTACLIWKQEKDPTARLDCRVTVVGPTYVSVRSGINDTMTAASHAVDIDKMLDKESFVPVMRTQTGLVKPVLCVQLNGIGPDNDPRSPESLAAWIRLFQMRNLDAVFVATPAPGDGSVQSVVISNLSRQLKMLDLPKEEYGTHLDAEGRVVDKNGEILNYRKGADRMMQAWAEINIEGNGVTSEWINAQVEKPILNLPGPMWVQKHVRQAQYCLQIVKCEDAVCCSGWRTNYNRIFPDRFLPPPMRIVKTADGLKSADPANAGAGRYANLAERGMLKILEPACDYGNLPFDYFCPSARSQLPNRVCPQCGIYHSSDSALRRHMMIHSGLQPMAVQVGAAAQVQQAQQAAAAAQAQAAAAVAAAVPAPAQTSHQYQVPHQPPPVAAAASTSAHQQVPIMPGTEQNTVLDWLYRTTFMSSDW